MGGIFNLFRNEVNALIGNKQAFGELIAVGDISRAKRYMEDYSLRVSEAMMEYDVNTHKINSRENKIIFDKKGRRVRVQEQWKIPIPFQVKINELATSFMFSRAPTITQRSEGTDQIFEAVQQVMEETRFESKLKQCKSLAGSETMCAKLYYLYKDPSTKIVELKSKILATSFGDELRPMRDINQHMISFGHGYTINTASGTQEYFDIYTKYIICRCKKSSFGWDVKIENNIMEVIPIILYEQEKEWDGTEPIINRIEYIVSTTADINDYFASPAVVADKATINNMPEKDAVGKLYISDNPDAVKYLTWDSMPENKKHEYATLKELLYSMTSTPDISFDNIKALGNIPSGKALEFFFMDALFKAKNRRDDWAVYIDRDYKVVAAIIGNVTNIALKQQANKLRVNKEFHDPLPEDISAKLKDLCDAVDSRILSYESGVEKNPLVSDHKRELERLKKEDEEYQRRNVFEVSE